MSNKRKISLILDKNQLNAPYVGNIIYYLLNN